VSSPIIPIPDEQAQAFNRAVCARLGIDPAIVSDHDFRADVEVDGGEKLGQVRVSFTAYLPADELLAMLNGAAP
jgi:hypothetical protein